MHRNVLRVYILIPIYLGNLKIVKIIILNLLLLKYQYIRARSLKCCSVCQYT
jgi:hypothetical protein